MKDAEHLAIWSYLLMKAIFEPRDIIFNSNRVTLNPGQFSTGRKVISSELVISESKVQRILKAFESEQQIEQVTDFKCRIITIVNWEKYQSSEQVFEQQVNSSRTGSEQVVNTKEEYKNVKNVKIKEIKRERFTPPQLLEVIEYMTERNAYKPEEEAESFMDHYESNGWKVGGKSPMKSWKASVRNWLKPKNFKQQNDGLPFG